MNTFRNVFAAVALVLFVGLAVVATPAMADEIAIQPWHYGPHVVYHPPIPEPDDDEDDALRAGDLVFF